MSDINKATKKVLVIGDGGCGKTSLLYKYAKNTFTTEYVPTVFETTTIDIRDASARVQLSLQLWDTAGQEDYDRIRTLSYADTHIVLICFSLVDKLSLKNVREKWAEEVQHFCEGVPKIVVGTKLDLRASTDPADAVHSEKGKAIAKSIGAKRYIECSAQSGENVDHVFENVIEILLHKSKVKKTSKKIAKVCNTI